MKRRTAPVPPPAPVEIGPAYVGHPCIRKCGRSIDDRRFSFNICTTCAMDELHGTSDSDRSAAVVEARREANLAALTRQAKEERKAATK